MLGVSQESLLSRKERSLKNLGIKFQQLHLGLHHLVSTLLRNMLQSPLDTGLKDRLNKEQRRQRYGMLQINRKENLQRRVLRLT